MRDTIIQLLSNLKVEHSTIIVCHMLHNCVCTWVLSRKCRKLYGAYWKPQ